MVIHWRHAGSGEVDGGDTNMTAYYNDNDAYCAQWLRNLIAENLIAKGDVDERSIKEVTAKDVANYTQCHFFAGIGGWSYALRMAGWPDSREVWTGSCPCQPFSVAGSQRGTDDERHLWPEWAKLIARCRPTVVLGEQVASKAGREWLAGVRAKLERSGYRFGAADLCAAGVAAPHRRQRLWFVGRDGGGRSGAKAPSRGGRETDGHLSHLSGPPSEASREKLANAASDLADANGGNAGAEGLQRSWQHGQRAGDSETFWSTSEWLFCTDGKFRRVEPGTFPVAHGIPKRVAKLRALGNAIVPQIAAEFIKTFVECSP